MTLPAFEANALPLGPGMRLLEASAGTGKTFALAHLVLRLLSEGPNPLAIEQLLVVTFTDAAAAELRDRIARRLQDALNRLEARDREAAANSGESLDAPAPGRTLKPPDPPMAQWLQAQPPEATASLCGRLLLALEQLDRADITTIHGFCRRTLQRHALEAGLGPAVALESAAAERRGQIVHDYWLQQVLPLPTGQLAGLISQQVDPDRLSRLLQILDGDPALELDPLPPAVSTGQPLAPQLQEHWAESWQRFQQLWRQHGAELEPAFCASANAAKANGQNHKPYRLKPKPDQTERVQAWLDGFDPAGPPPSHDAVLAVKELREYFHPGSVQKLENAAHGEGASLPQAPLLQAIAELVDGPAELLLLHFAHWGRAELARRRERSGEMGFGQLLEQLDPGDQPSTPLLSAVAERYRAALIDEFQDTDPIQWRILQGAFGGDPPRHLLVMVGDPKQAIYRFRGGELATYRQAADEADERYGLVENRRSSQGLVDGLNALMRPKLRLSDLDVPEVHCRARGERLRLAPQERPLQLLPIEPEQLEAEVAAFCQTLLERRLVLESDTLGPRPLQAGDLCLLVNRHSEAEALRVALERRGLPSRLVSQGDVFASEGALALQRLLDALASPGDPGRLRLLAACPLLGWSAERIRSSEADRWDELADQLSRLAGLLPQQGVTAVLGQLLGSASLARLALRGRALADLQQAAELVQEQMHRQGLSPTAAADWLRNLRLQEERDVPDSHLCRSDAAESSIAVVTVHRSKGLEFPVVICPYLWKGRRKPRAGTASTARRWRPPGSDRPRLDLHLNPHWGPGRAAAQQDSEAELQESERRAYVACTRARHLLVLGWPGAERAEEGNPLSSWLLEHGGAAERELPLQRLNPADQPPRGPRWRPGPPAGALELGRIPHRQLDNRWGRASYSAWTHGGSALPPEASEEGRDSDALSRDGDDLAIDASAGARADGGSSAGADPRGPDAVEPHPTRPPGPSQPGGEPGWPAVGPLGRFPRGAAPGDALHRILEAIDYPALAAGALEPARQVVSRELERAGLAADLADGVLEGLKLLVATPLGGELEGFRLADLPPASWLNEMNFDLPLAVPERRLVRSRGLAEVFQRHPGGRFGEAYARQLEGLSVASRGFLTGSIDLVFRCGERWWVADWKSNWLGRRDGADSAAAAAAIDAAGFAGVTDAAPPGFRCGPNDYSSSAMETLMATNHYPLQAHLYLVALHRYLRWRLPGYRPDRHLGGYAYVFLRGVPGALDHSPETRCAGVPGVLVERPPLARLQALDQLLREGQP
jgi:exodeoxyribonuclease V beta subunit